jgi:hypothetical protein
LLPQTIKFRADTCHSLRTDRAQQWYGGHNLLGEKYCWPLRHKFLAEMVQSTGVLGL